jgi:methionyl-tRNA formyltransferase
MRIVFAGTPEFAVPSLHAIAQAERGRRHEIVGVLTREDAPLGRKRLLTPSPVARAAAELGLEIFKANQLGDTATTWVEGLNADLGVIVAYGGLVRAPLLTTPRLGWINLHFSDLPRWRGAAPVQRALMAGEQTLGMTVFRLVEALDAGDVLTRDAHTFAHGTTSGEALTHLATSGTTALLDAISRLEADANAGDAQTGETSYAHKLNRDDARLDLSRSARDVLNHWAGVTPEPGAFVLLDAQPFKIHELRHRQDADRTSSEKAPGSVELLDGAAVLHLADGQLELVTVQPFGKPAMSATDWLRGRSAETVLS